MQGQAGQSINLTIARKEAELRCGNGTFWWGIGNILPALQASFGQAEHTGVDIPVLFSLMLSKPAKHDISPDGVLLWTAWWDGDTLREIPNHIVCLSKSSPKPKRYALVCQVDEPIAAGEHCYFNPKRCITFAGKLPAGQQVTALLLGDLDSDHAPGPYSRGFRARLVEPWLVRLAKPCPLSPRERELFDQPRVIEDWANFTADLRARH
jgi:hypothetical protein